MSPASLWWRLVRFGFRLLYNELALTYDLVSWIVSMGAWRCWQRAALSFLPEVGTGCILEVAHGTGNLHLDLRQAGYDVVGMDFSPYMGQITRRKFAKRGQRAILVQAKAQSLPFENGSMQAIVCTFPTSFIFESATLQEFYRVLEPDGRFVVVLNGVFVSGGFIRRVLEWAFRVTGQRSEPDTDYAADVWAQLTGYGFESITQHGIACPRSVAQVIVVKK